MGPPKIPASRVKVEENPPEVKVEVEVEVEADRDGDVTMTGLQPALPPPSKKFLGGCQLT